MADRFKTEFYDWRQKSIKKCASKAGLNFFYRKKSFLKQINKII